MRARSTPPRCGAPVFLWKATKALHEAGDLLIPMQEGVIGPTHVAGDLHELTSGKKARKDKGRGITLFKSVGCALEDLATAELLV